MVEANIEPNLHEDGGSEHKSIVRNSHLHTYRRTRAKLEEIMKVRRGSQLKKDFQSSVSRATAAVYREMLKQEKDELTGLINRRVFLERVQNTLDFAKRIGGFVTVYVLDLDGFKSVNNRLGHLQGDKNLRAFARLLRESVRSYDEVARVGGDEFGILQISSEEHDVQEGRKTH